MFGSSNLPYSTISGVEREVEASGLGNQIPHKGRVVRGFEPHTPDCIDETVTNT